MRKPSSKQIRHTIALVAAIVAIAVGVVTMPNELKKLTSDPNSETQVPKSSSSSQNTTGIELIAGYVPTDARTKINYEYQFQLTLPNKEVADDFDESISTTFLIPVDQKLSSQPPKVFETYVEHTGLSVVVFRGINETPEDTLRKIYALLDQVDYYEIKRSEFAGNAKGIQFVDKQETCSPDPCAAGWVESVQQNDGFTYVLYLHATDMNRLIDPETLMTPEVRFALDSFKPF